MSRNLYDAHRQWATRPADERFGSLEELLEFTENRKAISSQQVVPLEAMTLGITHDSGLTLNGSLSLSYLSNWSFGQLSRLVGAPANYLRTLPVDMARNCLQYGLEKSDQESKVLIRAHSDGNGNLGERYASAFTSPSYGRIWDADVVRSLTKAVDGTGWHVPQARTNGGSESAGLYASDRDMFAFMINDDKPVEVGNAKLGRGFFCFNSETGASTFGLTTFLYNYVCRNHIVWGAEDVKELKIYHRSHAPEHFYGAAIPILNNFVADKSLDESIKVTAGTAMEKRVGNSLEDVLGYFKEKPFTRKEISSAWETGLREGEDVTSVWGMVQGLTAYARDMKYIDKRVNLERRAGALLKQKVAA